MSLRPHHHRPFFPPVSCDRDEPVPLRLVLLALSPMAIFLGAFFVGGSLWNHYVLGLCASAFWCV